MEIVDSQVHLNMVGLDAGLAAMDATGVHAVLIDEYISPNPSGGPQIGTFFSDTGFRYDTPMSREAVARDPGRFAFVARVSPDDPELEDRIAGLRADPGCVALRLIPHLPVRPGSEAAGRPPVAAPPAVLRQRLRAGDFEPYLGAAERADVPVFLQLSGHGLPGDLDLFESVARAHPGLTVIVDHMGVAIPAAPGGDIDEGLAGLRALDRLADLPNVALKWCHMIRLSRQAYPWRDVDRQLHRIVGIFGADRIMWGSDWTIDLAWNSWAEALLCVRESDLLGDEDKSSILGATARELLRWPASRPVA